ncbi:hypothetical protein CS006_10480 [Bifidobacterium primatium]|uniref:Uncharacterized protein n=2 Tax=Bifidobacterium TaxID=1678 RepID=A0A2M9H6A6_9BIFI|nr:MULTISPECIES: hypothetical protein [Bifidobacterium]NEG95994.1 hypothetical protein [Bifidobacterium sp. SMB2]NEH12459.1 hypothetical protein [Bifidobacterium saimiriisciurei]PJM72353.1 hypothetical protein CS006_10480 [Bifidobacterium primatium]
MSEPRIIVTFTCKDTQDTTITEAARRLEQAGWQHVQVEMLAADHRGDTSRQQTLATALAVTLDRMNLSLAPCLYGDEDSTAEDIQRIAAEIIETVEILP